MVNNEIYRNMTDQMIEESLRVKPDKTLGIKWHEIKLTRKWIQEKWFKTLYYTVWGGDPNKAIWLLQAVWEDLNTLMEEDPKAAVKKSRELRAAYGQMSASAKAAMVAKNTGRKITHPPEWHEKQRQRERTAGGQLV
jgi:hypothetical protein